MQNNVTCAKSSCSSWKNSFPKFIYICLLLLQAFKFIKILQLNYITLHKPRIKGGMFSQFENLTKIIYRKVLPFLYESMEIKALQFFEIFIIKTTISTWSVTLIHPHSNQKTTVCSDFIKSFAKRFLGFHEQSHTLDVMRLRKKIHRLDFLQFIT